MRIERDIDRTVSFVGSQGTTVRGTLSKLSRRNIVFEIYDPFSTIQTSEVLTDLKVRRGKDVVYQGDAIVTGVVSTSILVIVSATLVNDWTRLGDDPVSTPGLRDEVARFVDEWERQHKLDPNYQLKVADLRSFLSELSFWLDQVDLTAEAAQGVDEAKFDSERFEEIKAPVMPRLTRLFMELEDACRQLDVDEVESHKQLAQRDLLPLMMASPFFNRVYSKPLGYAGDYEMVNMMFRKERGGKTTYAQIVNEWLLNGGPPQAHRNRIYMLEKMLEDAADQAIRSNKCPRVLNVGCGPVQELQLFIAKNPAAPRFSFDLLDFNPETLAYAKRQIESITSDRPEAPKVTYILKTVQELLRQAIEMETPAQSYDVLYCAGLFDYLSDRVCAKLVKLFYQWCEPGGRVLVTNVHSSNPVKGLMEHVMEWHLVMRDESDMLRLAPDPALAKVYTDETGINVFLEIVKPAN
ncbi:class I SAM-dependent methyltransferase [Hyphomicrobium methylovorum]|uniref:class I SAM-dependent methyltransferase n=1 Tax=Hyphomicrobium methylovorum TaxID=84 RepID=UPI0015E68D54|nr:class I SAM-dependent methyltransferase [Hyphomicrobium methylovorum]MBA2127669.1 class I SAM-dependent methyltransferase [Hyphomicrobium methylovorum]